MSDALRLAEVTFRRGETEILRGIDLVVGGGERWVLLGQNGCGKTTLLTLAGAREHPSSGTVEVLGHALGKVDIFGVLWPRIGQAVGRHKPSGRLTAREVVITGIPGTNGIPLRWTTSDDERAKVNAALSGLGLTDLADRSWELLSNGEQRRTLLARALVRTPDLLLLDEPAAGLDLPARERLVDALDDLAVQRPELPTVLVTHHVEEIPVSTTHVALMAEGLLQAAGPIDDTLTAEALTACFGMPLDVRRTDGRWTARSLRPRTPDGVRPRASS